MICFWSVSVRLKPYFFSLVSLAEFSGTLISLKRSLILSNRSATDLLLILNCRSRDHVRLLRYKAIDHVSLYRTGTADCIISLLLADLFIRLTVDVECLVYVLFKIRSSRLVVLHALVWNRIIKNCGCVLLGWLDVRLALR